MFRFAISLMVLLAIGCNKHNYQVADPVVGPVPPRRVADVSTVENTLRDSGVTRVAYEEKQPLPMTAVAARVNGEPILVGEVLEQYSSRLKQLRSKVTDEQFRQGQETIIRRDLPNLIEQRLMVSAVRAKLKKEQLDAIEEQLDAFFEQEVDRMKRQFQVETAADLEALLQQQGMSLETMRKMFGERQLANEFIRTKVGEDAPLTRRELLDEYNRRLDEYAEPAQVKWQQLQISRTGPNGANAVEKMDQALADLRAGMSFAEVVRKYSDGPLAENGGHWDWTQPESIANKDLRKALETLSPNEVSSVISTENMLQLVKVTASRPARHTPFAEVQEDIRKELMQKRREVAAQQVIDDLKSQAVIWTIFDEVEG